MRRILCVLLILAWTSHLLADKYLRQGATGTGSGDDWTNAYTTCAAAETGTTRAQGTLWLADTTTGLAGCTWNTAVSGTTVITVKKATVADHGTSVGWLDSYGDGQFLFTSENSIRSSYWIFDGITGGGPGQWESGFGIRSKVNTGGSATQNFECQAASNPGSNPITNVTFRHMDVEGPGEDISGNHDNFFLGNCDNVTMEYVWGHNSNRTILITSGASSTGALIQYNLFSERHAVDGTHGELFAINNTSASVNWVIRYNLFRNSNGTGLLVIKDFTQSGYDIYGNVFYRTNSTRYTVGNGIITDSTNENVTGVRVFNNTFLPYTNSNGTPVSTVTWDVSTGNTFQGNLVINTGSIGGVATQSYNTYTTTTSETGGQQYTGTLDALFQDQANYDYRLKIATSDTTAASLPNSTDMFGTTRGGDGTWDRGAYEFVSTVQLPDVDITAPTTESSYQTNVSPLTTLAGTCVDDGSVSSVTWSNSLGGSGTATGTTSWSVASIALTAGDNVITVTCTDNVANTSQDALTVNYTPIPATPMDDFNRSSQGNLGPNWTNQNTVVPSVSGNQAISTSAAWHVAYWDEHVAPDNQFSQATVRDFSGTSRNSGVMCRAAGTTDSTRDGYAAVTNGTSGAGNTQLNRFNDGVLTVLTTYATTVVVGSVWRIECEGSNPVLVRVYDDGVQVGTTYSDSSAGRLTSGQFGVALYGVNAALDDWSGGEISASDTTPPDVAITAPTSTPTYITSTTPITTLAGTASDGVGVSSCTCTSSTGASCSVTGTTSWSISTLDLSPGTNTVTVSCVDAATNSGSAQIAIDYSPPVNPEMPVRLRIR